MIGVKSPAPSTAPQSMPACCSAMCGQTEVQGEEGRGPGNRASNLGVEPGRSQLWDKHCISEGHLQGQAAHLPARGLPLWPHDSWQHTEWTQGCRASSSVWREDSGLLSRPGKKEGPHLAMTGASHGFPQAAAPMGVFSRGTMRTSGSLSCGARQVRSPCAWRGGAGHHSRVMGNG